MKHNEKKFRMKKIRISYSLAVIGCMLLLHSCGITKKYETPDAEVGTQYRDTLVTDSTTLADIPWKEMISDTILQQLIEEGLAHNLDLKVAVENINQAEATLQQARLSLLPSLSAEPSVTFTRTSQAALNFGGANVNLKTKTFKAQLASSWEIDVWGKLRSSKRSALAAFLETEAAARAVKTQLISDIAVSYYTLLAYDEDLRINKETLANRKDDQETMKLLKESAVVDGAAVVQSEASRYEIEASIPDIELSIREQENALSILLGRSPGTIERSTLEEQIPYTDLKVGFQSDLLRNRPDIQEAEFAFRSAFEDVKMAKAYFYPSLTITANGGLSSLTIEDFFNKSIFYTIVGGLTQPIFANGENKARLKTNESLQRHAFYNYRTAWLTAAEEVSNNLYMYQKAVQKHEAREKQLTALEKSVDFTESLLEYTSSTNYTDVLTTKQSLLSAQVNSISDKLQELQAVIQLYRALGGGWNDVLAEE
ncbi:efflux transporter, outer membrane factor (OMF) lipoprotein, NodT family [Pustulibacterium marinum]|uniref:Efflux transporter, outer membrane factor (OMF) lipoprotein, NodT family n=2 Tax=Pustulibacterium marinum TaxID=1224947 RepID=A0A1I7ITD6_9FLAO|nr:efflux transporter, outer membrane factor (OMF) lipoprotein, NodT family [Pustulibacterium marinum]